MEINTIEENYILQDKSKQYLEERLESDDYGLVGDLEEIRGAFSDGCLFTVELAQKIIEEMFSSFAIWVKPQSVLLLSFETVCSPTSSQTRFHFDNK